MSDIVIRRDGHAGRITLNRPKALNALTWEMLTAIEAALDTWRDDPAITLLIIDATGEKAFCAGGDIAEMYAAGRRGDYDYGRRFWRDEYRINAKLFHFPKPVVTFLQGFTMGGGVGVGCHGSHRIVGESSRVAMPECGIGLVPDVGGSLLLAQAPGRLGEFLGTTATRMHAEGANLCGFADYFIAEQGWETLKEALSKTGDWALVDAADTTPPHASLADMRNDIDRHFAGEKLGDIMRSLQSEDTEFTAESLKRMGQNAPLSIAVTVEMIHRVRTRPTIENALDQEYRFTHRAMEHGDFIEGIRATIIDRDRTPKWQHGSWEDVTGADVLRMTLPLGEDALKLEGSS